MNIARYAKALVPVVIAVVLYVLSHVGVTPDMSVKEVVTLAVAAVGVYLTPNKS